jgi:uncharacterized protein YndB with AHSA1/START domain
VGETAEEAEDVVRKAVQLEASADRVFQLLTDPDHVERWFADVATIEPWVGGAVEFAFYNRNGTLSVFGGRVTAIRPPVEFTFTWHHDSWQFPPLEVEFRIEPAAGGARLRLTHRGFTGQPTERDIHDEGWDHYLRRLTAVAGGALPERLRAGG